MITVEGIYRNGNVELLELPAACDETRVLVTFLEPTEIDLRERHIGEEHAADLRARLARFADDWNRPEMDIYDED